MGFGVGVGVGVGLGLGLGVGAPAKYEISLERTLSNPAVLYALTAKKYILPDVKFETIVEVAFPTLIC